jgi:hypothetical protein
MNRKGRKVFRKERKALALGVLCDFFASLRLKLIN